MAKTLVFEYDEKEYTLEYTRRTVEMMEKNGFVVNDLREKPMSTLPILFSGAFLAHHRFLRPEVIEEIYKHMTNKEALIGKLAEMYNDPIAALLEEPEEGTEGNVNWKADF